MGFLMLIPEDEKDIDMECILEANARGLTKYYLYIQKHLQTKYRYV